MPWFVPVRATFYNQHPEVLRYRVLPDPVSSSPGNTRLLPYVYFRVVRYKQNRVHPENVSDYVATDHPEPRGYISFELPPLRGIRRLNFQQAFQRIHPLDRKSTRLNSSHDQISYAV